MFGAIMVLALTVVAAYILDYRVLRNEGSMKQWIAYGIMFTAGLITTGVYLLTPTAPDLLHFVEQPFRPIQVWLQP